MAQQKLSPRQKMIGMMYLVLTAMLALNVSKEAVKAFMKVDKGLTLTVENYAKKNNLIYSEFDRAAAENPTKAGPYKVKAYAIKERADELYNYIQGLKIEIIKTAEKDENTPAVTGNTYDIEKVKRYDEPNVPSEILVGANENGKAWQLRTAIKEYRDFLITTLDGKNPVSEESLRKILVTDDAKNEDGEMEPWPNLMFQTMPVVGATALLTKIQVDVRNAETEVLNFLYGQIDASSFKFNKLGAIVVPITSNYVTLGSEYRAQVFISAQDSTQQPTIKVGDMVLPLDDSGKGIYSVKPSTLGAKTWGGVISLRAPDGSIKEYPFKSEYSVGEPNVVVSPTAMNVMYMDIANPVDVSVPGVGSDKIRISVTNGSVTTEKVKNSKGENFRGNWAITPKALGQMVQVNVTSIENGKTINHGVREFRVKPLPKPEARFGGKNAGTIDKNTAVAQAGVFAVLPDFDFDLVYNVTGFTLLYSDRLGDVEKVSTGSKLTAEQKDLLGRLTRGKSLIIKDVKAVGPGNKSVDLNPIVLTIQ
jgi:gliding motility-associated protein GldM